MNGRLKVYLENSYISYLTGRLTTREPIAAWQAASRQWWAAVAPSCDLFVPAYFIGEAQKGGADDVARRMEVLHGLSELGTESPRIGEIAKALIRAHALPEDETIDRYHIATAAYYGMDDLLIWNCLHMANEFTLPISKAFLSRVVV